MASSSLHEEMVSVYQQYENEIQDLNGRRGHTQAGSQVASEEHPLWGKLNKDAAAGKAYDQEHWPALPTTKSVLVSELISCKPEKLPGPDFAMPLFDVEHWDAKAVQHIPDPEEQDIAYYVPPIEATYWLCYGLRLNKPAFLSGVKGCGKSALPKWLASKLNWPFLRKQMAKDLDSSEFFGQWKAENGNTIFVPGDLPQTAMYGMLLLIDEISNAPPELHPSLHQCLEKGGKIYLNSEAGDIEDKIIVPKDTFRIIATDNTRGQGDSRGHYAGTDVMNSATMDRFRVMIPMDYMSKPEERKVLRKSVPGMTDKLATMMIDVAQRVRASYKAGDLSETMSLRPMIEWGEKIMWTRDILGSLETTFINKIESESERGEVTSHVQAVFGSFLNESA